MEAIFKLHNVSKSYGQREVLNINQLTILGHEIYAFLGPNGSGKTTLLRILALLSRNTAGKVEVLGEEVTWSKDQLLRLRRQMAMVTQTSFMFEGSVFSNVAYGLKVRGQRGKEIKQTVASALDLVGMTSFINYDTCGLSGGERQKIAIARALAVKPKVLFLDEPTANIDPHSSLDMEKYIRLIKQELKTTVIMVTHNLFQARRLADQVYFLWDGYIIESGRTQEMFTNPQDKRTRLFLLGDAVF
jgi:tungstate transport system ATP-binding protein